MLTLRRRAGWALPATAGALAALLGISVIVGREQRHPPSPSPSPSTSSTLTAIAPGSAALHSARPDGDVSYGAGLVHVYTPAAAARDHLTGHWRELWRTVGRALLRLTGTSSRYYQVTVAVVAPEGAARLEIQTSMGERGIALVRPGAVRLIGFRPFLSSRGATTGVALTSVQTHSARPGKRLLLSRLQANYVTSAEAAIRMLPLSDPEPNGLWLSAK